MNEYLRSILPGPVIFLIYVLVILAIPVLCWLLFKIVLEIDFQCRYRYWLLMRRCAAAWEPFYAKFISPYRENWRMGNAYSKCEDSEHASKTHDPNEEEQETPRQSPNSAAYYAQVLGILLPVTREALRKRYHQLAQQYHPDKVAHLGPEFKVLAESKMKVINEAYGFLKSLYEE